jgi:tricorn protease
MARASPTCPFSSGRRPGSGTGAGRPGPIWIATLSDVSIEKLPRDNSNDFDPMWVGKAVYFLSDRNGPVTLFSYDTDTRQVRQVVANDGLDIKSASAGPGAIVYEQFGEIHLLDLQTGRPKRLDVTVRGDLPNVRPRFVRIDPKRLFNIGISPSGARAVFEAHGDILTAPAEKGDIRNLTNTTAVAERDPAWSPDGKWIAFFSDAPGNYQLELRAQNGLGEPRKIPLGTPASFYYSPTWSPDSKKIAYIEKGGTLWYVDLDKGTPKRVDVNYFADRGFFPAWSPDSKWLAYVKISKNHLHAVHLFALEKQKSYQITDGMSDAQSPIFDGNGKYLYFTASTDVGLSLGFGDLSAVNHPVTRSVYVTVLDKELTSPLPPESDDEKADDDKPEAKKAPGESAKGATGAKDAAKEEEGKTEKKPVVVKVDIEDIGQRILALPIPAHNYLGLWPGKEGVLFLVEGPNVMPFFSETALPPSIVQKFDLSTRKTEKMVEGVTNFALSRNGEKMLFQQGEGWMIATTTAAPKAGEGALKLDGGRVYADPRLEWKQMYHEVWRIQRDFFYDPHYHGLDLAATEKRYAPYLENLGSREELTYLFEEMLGELTAGHTFVWGPPSVDKDKVKDGLLGADYQVENGRYRFVRVYNGENWNPQLRAPLTQPGVNVRSGDYLLAVSGRELRATDNLYSFFLGTAGKAIVLKVGANADGSGAREVTVVPVEDEGGLRNLAWIEDNRRRVDAMTGGRVAYVYLPDTFGNGYSNFNRYYFAQIGKEGAVIDERFNGGGYLADYFIDYMRRPVMSCATTREGADSCNPSAAIYGPKAMIINESAGSGGDALPWYFRRHGLGPLVGKRTWGGLIGIGDYPELMDGGGITAPRWAIYGLNGEWEVENRGIAPDIEVELEPKAFREGHDLQLEAAVKAVMDQLAKQPLAQYKRPEYPNYHQKAAPPGQRQ